MAQTAERVRVGGGLFWRFYRFGEASLMPGRARPRARFRASCANLASSKAAAVSSAGAATVGPVAFFWPLRRSLLNIAFYHLLWRGGFLTSSAFYETRFGAALASNALKQGRARLLRS